MNVVLMGPPGSGKGTQSKFFVSQKKFQSISTGDLFREALRKQTSLGKQAQHYLDQGKLVPDEVTIDLVEDILGNLNQATPLLFDGFPRTLKQAEALDRILKGRNESGSWFRLSSVYDFNRRFYYLFRNRTKKNRCSVLSKSYGK